MEEAYSLAVKKSQNSGEKAKHYYDHKIRSTLPQPDDRVLVRNLSKHGGSGKLRPHWEEQVNRIVHQKGPDSSVYEVKPENRRGPTRALNRNLLLQCSFLPVEPVPKKSGLSRPVQSRRKPTRRELPPRFTRPAKSKTCPRKEDCSSDEDGDIILVSGTTKSLSPSAKSFQPQGISLPQTSAKSDDPVSLSLEGTASVSNELCPGEQASFSNLSVKNHTQTLLDVSELSQVQQHKTSSSNPAFNNNETEGVTERSTETEMPNTCESLDLQSRPAIIWLEPSRLTYYAPGSRLTAIRTASVLK